MYKYLPIISIALAPFITHTVMAQEQSQCDPLEKILAYLHEKWAEEPLLVGDGKEGLLVTSNHDGSTWTMMTVDTTTGIACIKMDGSGIAMIPMTTLPPPVPGKNS
jgi:hypothetical protein